MLPLLATLVVVMATMTSRVGGVERYRPGATLLHLAVDNSTGVVYVGAVNHVYQLSADRLEPISVAVTGNVPSYQCRILNCREFVGFNTVSYNDSDVISSFHARALL